MIPWVLAALVVGALALAELRVNLRSGPVWKRFAEEHGLALDSAKGAVPRLHGERRGFEIVLLGYGKNDAGIEIRGVDPWFQLAAGNSKGSERALGDPKFDARVSVRGDRDFALSLLHHDVRRLVESIVSGDEGRLDDGSLRAFVDEFRQVPQCIERLLDLAEHLRRPSSNDLPPLLARNALDDPAPEFRRLAFRQLATEYHEAQEARVTATRLLDDERPEPRLEAARFLLSRVPEERAAAMTVLVAIVEFRGLRSSLREQALHAIAVDHRGGDSETAVRLGTAILGGNQPPNLRRAAIEALVRTEASEALMEVTPTDDPAELIVLARGLGKIGDLRAQETLLPMLERPYEDLQIAAAEALGAVGNAKAVPALRQAALSHPDPRSFEGKALEQAVEDAVAKIQHRLGGSQGGEVSITSIEPLQGAVSPADDGDQSPDVPEGGELSLES